MLDADDAPFGLLAEFRTADDLGKAVKAARREGFTAIEAYTPLPVEGLPEMIAPHDWQVDIWALVGALAGNMTGWAICIGQNVLQFPINVGGRPVFAWPAFMIPAFELTMLFGVCGACAAMLIRSGLPRLNHPLFADDRFRLASQNRFFLTIEADDPHYGRASDFLYGLNPLSVSEVPE